jgi:alcohol dehydrogenase YqhD (iron-dependent ADH family)
MMRSAKFWALAAAFAGASFVGFVSNSETRTAILAWVAPLCTTSATASEANETGFTAEMNAAMDKMMAAMAVKPSGDVDRDFATMMIPHHQGAIDMALAELKYGRNEQLRRIAQEIIVEQLQEIAAMRLALGQPLPLPTQPSQPATTSHMHGAGPAAR